MSPTGHVLGEEDGSGVESALGAVSDPDFTFSAEGDHVLLLGCGMPVNKVVGRGSTELQAGDVNRLSEFCGAAGCA